MIFVAKRVARRDVLDADDRGDVARVTSIDILALVRLNLDQSGNTLALVRTRIVNRVALGELAGVDAEEDELSDERIAPELESERAEFAIVVSRSVDRLRRCRAPGLGRRDVERARQIIDDGVDEILHAFVLEGGPADNGAKLVRDRLAADAGLQHLWGDRLLLEESGADFFVEIGDCRDEIVVSVFDELLMLLGDLFDFVGRAHRVVIKIDDRLTVDDVELPLEIVFACRAG